ncbi:MAG: TIGR02302 family protein [Xanthobacteraceae bacterium]|nr:MAG: TIGR02302 family protein [Xanthobacteraceae bacterium]
MRLNGTANGSSGRPDPAGIRLERALRRARWALAWERVWPHLARLMTVAGLFVAAAWAGLWLWLPPTARVAALAGFAALLVGALIPAWRLRWPSRAEALHRLDRRSGLAHRPATALTDTLAAAPDPVTEALWQTHRARTLAALRSLRAGLPSPRLALHDPRALRGLVVLLLAATFIAAGDERRDRLAAAFDWESPWSGGAQARLDGWVSPPPYTGRAPVILTGAPADESRVIAVPAGSVLTVRASGSRLDVAASAGLTETPADRAPEGSQERRFTIAADGSAHVRNPSGHSPWRFSAIPDRAPTIELAQDPERQAQGGLLLSYRIEDDYGVTDARATFAWRARDAATARDARPLYDMPDFALMLPNARTRNGVGQTVKDLSEHPYAGAELTLTLAARDEAGNEGHSAAVDMRLPERVFTKPLARALIEQRRSLAMDAKARPQVLGALEALLVAPETFTPEAGVYLGLRNVFMHLAHARNDEALRESVARLWALAVAIEDANMTDAEKALRAAQEALRQALERGASDEEIRRLTEQLRAAIDNYMRQLAEQLRSNPQQLARPLDPNARVMRPEDLRAMLDRMERMARSGDRDGARQLLEQLQQMLENLQMAQPGMGGDDDIEQALNELGDLARKQQQLRDRTFKQGQDQRRDRMRGQRSGPDAMNELRQDQQALRDRLGKLLEDMKKRGLGGQKQQGPGQPGDDLDEADSAMGEAGGQLGQGNADGAVDSQGRAADALRRGAQGLAQALQQMMGEGEGNSPGNRVGPQTGNGPSADPLGRPLRGRDIDDTTVQVPGEIDVQRVRRILEELRRRLGETERPQLELDYIERLLKE